MLSRPAKITTAAPDKAVAIRTATLISEKAASTGTKAATTSSSVRN